MFNSQNKETRDVLQHFIDLVIPVLEGLDALNEQQHKQIQLLEKRLAIAHLRLDKLEKMVMKHDYLVPRH